jgi:polyisoprenoid-binding protein YceI
MPAIPSRYAFIALLAAAATSVASAASNSAAGKSERFAIDPVHTRIAFKVDHFGFSKSIGTFSGANGTLDFDRDDWHSAKVAVDIPLQNLDMGDAKWKDKVLSASLLGVKQQPVARFVSTSVEPGTGDRALIHGTLSLHGHDSPVTLDAHLNALKRDSLTFKRTIGFSATTTLSRKALQVDGYPDAIGDAVEVQIEVEGQVAKDKAPETTAAPPANGSNR